jgi:outer membrane PBP1 activator LpoA protein
MHKLINTKSWVWGACAILLVAACTTTAPSGPQRPATNRQYEQAERLSREGNSLEAARLFEQVALQSPGELRDRLLLRAAKEYVRADNTEQATAVFKQVSPQLPSRDAVDRAIVSAELQLRAGRAERALAELNQIPQPLPQESLSEILSVRSRALFALNRPAAGVMTALDRERTLTSQQDQRANQRLIWEGLQRSANANADFTPPAGANSVVTGWLDLGRAALIAARNPFTAKEDLAQWRARYPTHPANSFLNEDVLPQLGVGLEYPPQIALVLPLSGRTATSGIAVRDGFMAALLQQEAARRPQLNVYDSAAMGALTAYRRAVADGAQFIVGPLVKDDVVALAVSNEVSVLTLALNQLPDETIPSPSTSSPPSLMFQFALDPEDEARQVAQRLAADGRMRGLVLLPNDDWGQRVFRAFDSELKTLGGTIAAMRFYDTASRDYSTPITQLLLVDESRARSNALNSILGQRLEFEPRRRGDAQFIFVGAFPAQGRSIRPALRFHLADDLPVYATSHIFEPDTQANSDIDGVLFPHMPLVISPDNVSSELRSTLSKYWPARARGNSRLYAFGFDAYRLVPLLKAGKFGTSNAVPGMTGLLSVDSKGRVRRELDWARVAEGSPVPLGAPQVTSSIR